MDAQRLADRLHHEARLGIDPFHRDRDLAPARNRGVGDEKQVEEELGLVLRDVGPLARPDEVGALEIHEALGDALRLAEVDLRRGGAGRAEGDARELQLGDGALQRLADQRHRLGVVRHLVEKLEPALDAEHRRDDVVAEAAGKQRRQIRSGEVRELHRLRKYEGRRAGDRVVPI